MPASAFFGAQTPHAVVRALDDFYAHETDITPDACRTNAKRFATARFDHGISTLLGRTGAAETAVEALVSR